MSKEVVSTEVAEAEFERFVDAMDLDIDVNCMDDEDKTAFAKSKRRLIRSIVRGDLSFNENGEPLYVPTNPRSKHKETLTFHERSGASLMAMDGKKQNRDVSKMYSVLAEMCKVPASTFAGLVGTDIKICEALFVFLMD